ncbi:DUF2510 domain-containing protein [Leifsonia poae]|uniref:DUF2510 domain-containing protein n=1 Tax=Leifsonia poae TaxID=110933 RepID=A0A9W6H958_9MICO|nr:DUF2510 domain-containing protein [Leifsonia poae]GLJ76204.1 hypothetical protein GCM10017584_17780 [Leifsonia poae]
MSNTNGQVPAGWYADPNGGPQLRWWDGAQWTEHYAPDPQAAQPVQPTQPVAPTQPVYTQPAAAQQPAYAAPSTYATPYPRAVVPERAKLAPGAAIYNAYIWLVVALPFVLVLVLPFWNPLSGIALTRTADGSVRAYTDPSFLLNPAYFILIFGGFIVDALVVVFAWLDYRDLQRKGVERPFHWAWAFFVFVNPGFLVYVIGRSIVVRKVAPGRGLAPIWVAIGLYVVSIIIAIIWVATLFSSLMGLMHTYGGYGV